MNRDNEMTFMFIDESTFVDLLPRYDTLLEQICLYLFGDDKKIEIDKSKYHEENSSFYNHYRTHSIIKSIELTNLTINSMEMSIKFSLIKSGRKTVYVCIDRIICRNYELAKMIFTNLRNVVTKKGLYKTIEIRKEKENEN